MHKLVAIFSMRSVAAVILVLVSRPWKYPLDGALDFQYKNLRAISIVSFVSCVVWHSSLTMDQREYIKRIEEQKCM